ncbi:MAG TPA: recombinase family protein [Anaerovoracaceae bacterium]|nr:recombinase family protein [Anaerovoracaceae bacterium]
MNNRTLTIIPPKLSNLPVIDRPIRIAAYCRASSPSEGQALSLEKQVQYYTDKIESFPFGKNAGVFADTATGRNLKRRPAFKKLMAKCRAGKVDLILTRSISRFGRNSLETIRVLRELRGRGVNIYFEQENIHLLDPTAQHVIEIYCALAQNESENKSHDIRWGIKEGFRTGISGYQNFACYGYRYDEAKQTLVIVSKEAKVVRMIFALRLQGYSLGAGKPVWNRECIRKILCNEKYAGAVMLQKTYVEDFFTGKQKKNTGQRDKYLYKNNHAAIVSWDIFERVNML